MTDDEGYAETNWTLGSNADPQSVEVKVKKADGSYIESTVTFTANSENNSSQNIEIVSGNNQTGGQGEQLSEPLVVIVKNDAGEVVSGQEITFTIVEGGGSVSQENVATDQNGNAETNWTLGNNQDAQTVKASIIDDAGNTIDFVNFTAVVNNNGGCGDLTSFTDPRDGQVYPVVQIGDQCWFAENLNYSTGNSWCYDDYPNNCNTYGRLYDWQTALTACPDGWHLPSDAEWTQLTDYLGGSNVAGGKMKSTSSLWLSPNTGATNSSGFSGLPGGSYNGNGNFINVSFNGIWWSSTESTLSAWSRRLNYGNVSVSRNNVFSETNGFSCRCLKD